MTYYYTKEDQSPDLWAVHEAVALSEMTNKDIAYCRYDEDTKLLKVIFTSSLSIEDETILDRIISEVL